MLRLFIRFELRSQLRDIRFYLAALAFFGLFLAAAVHQQKTLDATRAQIATSQAERRETFDKNHEALLAVERGEQSYDSLWDDPRGYYLWHKPAADYPLPPQAFLSIGQRDLFAPTNGIGIYSDAQASGNPIANPVPLSFGGFDPAFVFVFLLPLLILAGNYHTISRDRESGVAALLYSQPIDPLRGYAMRALTRFVLYLAVVGATLLVTAVATGTLGAFSPTLLLGLLLGAGLYMAFWFLLAFWVDLRSGDSQRNALVLLTAYLLLAVLVPTGVSSAAEFLFPTPTRITLVSQARTAAAEAQKRGDELLADYLRDHPQLTQDPNASTESAHAGFFMYYQRMFAANRAVAHDMEPAHAQFDERLTRQRRIEAMLSVLSPIVVVRASLDEMAGVSDSHYRSYARTIAQFSRDWREFFAVKAFRQELIGSTDLATLPQFQLPPMRMLPASLTAVGTLLLANVLLLGAILWRGRRKGAQGPDAGPIVHDAKEV